MQEPGPLSTLLAYAQGEVLYPSGPSGPALAASTMLMVPEIGAGEVAVEPVQIGQACRICAKRACPARSEPSVLPEVRP